MSTNLAASVSILPVKEIAKRCQVEEPTVTKWIRENRIPARKIGAKYFVREDHLAMFQKCGHHMPPDYDPIDNKTGQQDLFDPSTLPNLGSGTSASTGGESGNLYPFIPINCYEACEKGKVACSSLPKNPKFPNEFFTQINYILKECPQFENSYNNFMRDAVSRSITMLLQEMKAKGATIDPMWESYLASQNALNKKQSGDRAIASIQEARVKLHDSDKPSWAKFVRDHKPIIEKMEEPWKQMAMDSITGKLKKQTKKREEEEVDYDTYMG